MRERRLNVTPAEYQDLDQVLERCSAGLLSTGEVWAFMRDRFGADPGPYRLCIRFALDSVPAEGVARIDEGLCCPHCKAAVPWSWEDACRRKIEEKARGIYKEAIYGVAVRLVLPPRPCGHFDYATLRLKAWADWGEVRCYTYGDFYTEENPPLIPTNRRPPWSG